MSYPTRDLRDRADERDNAAHTHDFGSRHGLQGIDGLFGAGKGVSGGRGAGRTLELPEDDMDDFCVGQIRDQRRSMYDCRLYIYRYL